MHLSQNSVFLDKYLIKEQIGCGSFGRVYRLEHSDSLRSYALKIDISHKGNVLMEARTLSEIQGLVGIPKLFNHGIEEDYSYMIIELLGSNLHKVLKDCNGKFSLSTVIFCIKQILERIESLHKKGYLHRDLKSHQILLSLNKKLLFLTDFGLSRKYEMNSYHISYQSSCPRIGNATFSSLSNHSGVRQSRRDDLESVAYMSFYLAKGVLPWQCSRKMTTGSKWQSIFQVKSNCKVDDLCVDCPKEFGVFLTYTRSLRFEEKPDYAFCQSLFDLVISREQLQINRVDWIDTSLDLSTASEVIKEGSRKLSGDKHERRRTRKQTRSKTVFCKSKKLPNRSDVIYDRSDKINNFTLAFDESTYNSLKMTPRNVLPEFRNKKHALYGTKDKSCSII